jgi:hypothetical protein
LELRSSCKLNDAPFLDENHKPFPINEIRNYSDFIFQARKIGLSFAKFNIRNQPFGLAAMGEVVAGSRRLFSFTLVAWFKMAENGRMGCVCAKLVGARKAILSKLNGLEKSVTLV